MHLIGDDIRAAGPKRWHAMEAKSAMPNGRPAAPIRSEGSTPAPASHPRQE